MRRNFLLSNIIFFCVFCSFLLFADVSAEEINEVITNFDSRIVVNQDSTINVTEEIDYDSGKSIKHGIYRDIILKNYQGMPITLDNLSITDEFGKPINYLITNKEDNKINIRIGDAKKTFVGKKHYKINYTITKAIGYFDDYDEIYWNVTGSNWNFPILKSTARVILPDSAEILLQSSYCGYYGIRKSCTNLGKGEFAFENLNAGEGMTISVGFTKGIVSFEENNEYRNYQIAMILSVLIIILFALLWNFNKIKRKFLINQYLKNNTVIAEYDVTNMDPFIVSFFGSMGYLSSQAISALVVSLAIKGYIKIEVRDKMFRFIRLDRELPNSEIEKYFIETITRNNEFSYQLDLTKGEVRQISNLGLDHIKAQGFSPDLYKLNTEDLIKKSYAWFTTVFLSIFLAVNPGVFIYLLISSNVPEYFPLITKYLFSACVLAAGILSLIIGQSFKFNLNPSGMALYRRILGIKKYIEVAEKDKINFRSQNDLTPVLFEKMLPFAIALKLENKWSGLFANDLDYNPGWINNGSDGSNIHTINNVFNSINTSVGSDLSRAFTSSRSSSSSSGSSGGGFSGGGGGGGGGGSW